MYTITLSSQLQNRSFHVVHGTRTTVKCRKMKKKKKHVQSVEGHRFSSSNMQIYDGLILSHRRRRRDCLCIIIPAPREHHVRQNWVKPQSLLNQVIFQFSEDTNTLFQWRFRNHSNQFSAIMWFVKHVGIASLCCQRPIAAVKEM